MERRTGGRIRRSRFHALARRLGIDPDAAAVDPQPGLALALLALTLGDVAPFCPNAERMVYLQCSRTMQKG